MKKITDNEKENINMKKPTKPVLYPVTLHVRVTKEMHDEITTYALKSNQRVADIIRSNIAFILERMKSIGIERDNATYQNAFNSIQANLETLRQYGK